jgi:hypothetical protein
MEDEMYKQFEVKWNSVIAAEPQEVWDAITRRSGGWLWELEFEPRVGGVARGLGSHEGIVTAWDEPYHFATHSENPASGWTNEMDIRLEPVDGGTRLDYTHVPSVPEEDLEREREQCILHTDLYLDTLKQQVEHFAGREPRYSIAEEPGSFAEVAARFRGEGTIDYETDQFLGIRTDDALIRVLSREAWDSPVEVARHEFAKAA